MQNLDIIKVLPILRTTFGLFLIDYYKYYTLNTIYNGILINNEFRLEYVFAIINSKLIKFIWRTLYSDGKTIFPKVKKSQLDMIPVPICDIKNQDLICEILSQIISIKKINGKDDVKVLENEIDQLVYQLYELTDEEIAIVACESK